MQVLAFTVGFDFEVLGNALTIDGNGETGRGLPFSVDHFPRDIPSLGKTGKGKQHRHHEEGQDFAGKFH